MQNGWHFGNRFLHISYLGKQHPNNKIQIKVRSNPCTIFIHIFMRQECVKNVVFRVIDSRWLFISVTMSINLHDGREKRMLAERKNASYTLKMSCTLRFIQNVFDRHLHLLLNLSVHRPLIYGVSRHACETFSLFELSYFLEDIVCRQ